jgi:hypothetical protein
MDTKRTRHVQAQARQFTDPKGSGVPLFMMSAALTRGAGEIGRDMAGDITDASGRGGGGGQLIAAHHYCSQELVNLLLTGRAVGQVRAVREP